MHAILVGNGRMEQYGRYVLSLIFSVPIIEITFTCLYCSGTMENGPSSSPKVSQGKRGSESSGRYATRRFYVFLCFMSSDSLIVSKRFNIYRILLCTASLSSWVNHGLPGKTTPRPWKPKVTWRPPPIIACSGIITWAIISQVCFQRIDN